MEFAIPISRFDPTKVKWGQSRPGTFRRTVPFGYEEGQLKLSSLSLVLEPLRVIQIDWEKNQLVLEEVSQIQFLAKIEQFQTLANAQIKKNHREWLEGTIIPEADTIVPLQPWLKSQKITLYLSSEPSSVPFFTENGSETLSDKTVKPGDLIRAIVRLQGISLQMSASDAWTGKSRIQHYVVELYRVST